MRKVQKPTDDAKEVFLACISIVKDPGLRVRLESIRTDIETAATAFELAASSAILHTIPREHDVAGVVTKNEMTAVYNSRMVRKKTPGRAIYDKILALPAHGICPLCGQRTVSSLDHHLPKDYYPALAVVPANLIPACAECNKRKTNTFPRVEIEQTLHPYYDDVEGDSWLTASVSPTSPAAVLFSVAPPSSWDEVKAERVCFHFKSFKLAALYASHAACELVSIKHRLGRLFNQAGADAVREHLQEEADSRESAHINSWQTAMYKALAASDWFCEGGFLK